MICLICNEEISTINFYHHLKKYHKLTNKEYYDMYLKKDKEGFCLKCNKKTNFKSIKIGYNLYCSKECKYNLDTLILKKCKICGKEFFNLDTHIRFIHKITNEEYMSMFNCDKTEIYNEGYLKFNSDKIKGEQNPAYNHGGLYSPFSKKFIKYTNLSEDDKIKNIENHVNECKQTKEKNPSSNNTKIEHYIAKGFSEEESLNELKKRQTTFSYNLCIEKYGILEGERVWLNRQEKWLKSYKKINYSKISQELFWEIYNKIKNDFKNIYFATLNKNTNEKDYSNKNWEYLLKTKTYRKLDFFIEDNYKCIEFDGLYWHDEKTLEKNNKHRQEIRDHDIISANGKIKILHIKEKDYLENRNFVIQNCLQFIYQE